MTHAAGRLAALVLAALLGTAPGLPQDAGPFRLEKGDHLSIIGNTLADRQQHDGWVETLLQSRFPQHELVVRDLGFSGDELTLRLRSANFGSPEQWMTANKTDVVFAFFGANESWGGEAGLDKFRKDLEGFIRGTSSQKFNGKSSPRLVLFSPIAHENTRDPNLPDGSKSNPNLELYTKAMAEVARANGVTFVDLYHPSQKLYASAPRPLTVNGIHLTHEGNRRVAEVIDAALFGPPGAASETSRLERIRQAVLDKNFLWYNRYRTTDGFSIFGGRADLKFVQGQTNRAVAQREMEILDVMTANRDPKIWAAAQGRDLKVDDSNTPPFVPVVTNKPGAGPNGAHLFLSGEEGISKMQVHEGMKVSLFASEEKFPDLIKPQQMAFDARGRLWVTAWPSYPHWKPKDEMNDKILILEDTKGDGVADKCTVFADHLHNPTGFQFWNGGVIVAMCPEILFLKDSTGGDKADIRETLIHGMDTADTHHTSNSFVVDPGGSFYWQEGTFHHTQVETPYGPPARCANAGVYRYEPRTQKFEVYVSFGFANPHGHVFNRWGADFVTDGTGADTYDGVSFSGHIDFPKKHGRPPKPYQQRTRPCPGTEFLSSRHFPDELQGNLLVANVIGFQGILQYKFEEQGSGYKGTEMAPILQSTDPNFRPAAMEIGPDGALYFTDWQNPIIGHMQHNLRDPSRDHSHGRVYRVTCPSRPLLKPALIAGQSVEKLLDLLKEPEDRVRARARIELGGRKTADVIAACRKWMAGLDPGDKDHEHHLLEALWLHESHNVASEELLKRMLRSPEPRARAAATRVLRWMRDRVERPLDLLEAQANDEHPRVRLEAVIACSEFQDGQAATVALEVLKRPRDPLLEFALKETMSQLDAHWKASLREGKLKVAGDNPAAADFLLATVTNAELVKMPRTQPVTTAILTRMGIPAETRREALAALAKLRGADEINVLIDVIGRPDPGEHGPHVTPELGRLLAGYPRQDLFKAGDRIMALAISGATPEARQCGYAAWVTFLGAADAPYGAAEKTAEGLAAFLRSVSIIPDAQVRASLYARVKPILTELPAHLRTAEPAPGPGPSKGFKVEYFAENPGNAQNDTLQKLRAKTTAVTPEISLKQPFIKNPTDAFGLRFSGTLQAPKEGAYTFYIASDDGSRVYVDGKEVVNNDGLHGMSEKSGTAPLAAGPHALVVTYFNNGGGYGLAFAWQGPGFARQAPTGTATAGGGPETLQDLAVRSLAAIPGHEKEKFEDLAWLIQTGKNRGSAFEEIRRVERTAWPADRARPLVDVILAWATGLAPDQRTTPAALDALRFGQDLASLLPDPEGREVRARLKSLDVNILVIRPIRDQMQFDRKQIAVEAGKAVEILFDNTDIMPHNLVITEPGAMAEVGGLAEKMGLEGQPRDYLPDSKKILWATRLVTPGQTAKLSFTAPEKPGRYPYVCTFPGHWLVMNGVMIVVGKGQPLPAIVEAPVEVASGPSRAFVRMWSMADFEGDFKAPLAGRSFARGKEMFLAAGCIKCHTIAGEGAKIGPDLTKTAEKYKGSQVLLQIIEPSKEINEQFKTWLLQTADGDVLTGLIAKEDDREIHLLANLLKPGDVTVIPKSKIQGRKTAELSMMPTGLLVTLQKDEILDLTAYVEAGGDATSKLFRK
jgi:putative heme-binding domain-containing protein